MKDRLSGSFTTKENNTPWEGSRVCATCGLVLRGLTGSDRCPECHTALTIIDTNPFGDTDIARQYEIVTLLGRGGWGLVFKARQKSLDRFVAIKMLHTHLLSDTDSADRFKREATLVSKLTHPNITTVFDFGILPNKQPYLIMEYLPGTNLEELLKERGRLAFDEALPIFRQVCDGLQAAHEQNIVHRDLKPSNIRLIQTGGQIVVKIMDFGLARLSDNNLELTPQRLTRTGQTIGTPSFMSPEQCRGEAIDHRSDIYSLGCVMYESLAGQPVVTGSSVYQIMHQHINEEGRPLSTHGVSAPPGVEDVIDKTLAKNPAERQQSALEVKQALDKCLKAAPSRTSTRLKAVPKQEEPKPDTSSINLLEPPPSFFGKISWAVGGFFMGLNVRLALLFVIGATACFAAADYTYPLVAKEAYNQIAINLAQQADKQLPSSEQMLQLLHKNNLVWYYVASADGKINPKTAAFAPALKDKPQNVGRSVEWKGRHYWEAVAPLGSQLLHVGFDTDPNFIPAIADPQMTLAASCPLSAVFLGLGALLIFMMVSLDNCVSKHLRHLARACTTLLLARDAYSGVTGGGLAVSGAITEVKRMSLGLKQVRMQYDEQVAAKVSRDEELRKQKASHETEKQQLTKEYAETLTQNQAKISELYTKDAEEEFMLQLSREVDMLKSSQQLCQRVLDKLNDKFPTSVTFGAFFRMDKKTRRLSMVASLGFNDRCLTQLKRLDHSAMAENLFRSGTYNTLTVDKMRESGMGPLVDDTGIKAAILLPLSFQKDDLGFLAIYLRNERDVQERLRVFRNVVELASRQLYQTVLYEEEVEAARTDPLTGLRNKKFFYEIIPTMFERAAINPSANPISFAIIDGDKFKSINDTYGHQVGDKMLEELAKVLRNCVRTNQQDTSTGGRGDYLIRYGGEEFIIVMERTNAQQACEVAERVRLAIEKKHDWPAGIHEWTVSIGVATYPFDAQNASELMEKADTALYYVKEELGRNRVCYIDQVPKSYKTAKKAGVVSGELGVFEPAALLQSMVTAQKTGILTVQGTNEKQHFWMLLDAGKPVQARLGKFGGAPAIVEFITTFEEGNFSFQEQANRSSAKLPKMSEEFSVNKSLERCLMDAALAQDNYNAAKTIIPSAEIWVRPTPGPEFEARWNAVMHLPEPPTPEESEIMAEILKRAGEGRPLAAVFQSMDTKLSATVWRAAALLIQHGLVQTRASAPTANV